MSNNKFTELDGALLAFIGMHGGAFGASISVLHADQVIRALADELKTERGAAYRVIERRLQSLRKAGRIEFRNKTGWHLVMEG